MFCHRIKWNVRINIRIRKSKRQWIKNDIYYDYQSN